MSLTDAPTSAMARFRNSAVTCRCLLGTQGVQLCEPMQLDPQVHIPHKPLQQISDPSSLSCLGRSEDCIVDVLSKCLIMSSRVAASGGPRAISRSRRPGLRSHAGTASMRFVATTITICCQPLSVEHRYLVQKASKHCRNRVGR